MFCQFLYNFINMLIARLYIIFFFDSLICFWFLFSRFTVFFYQLPSYFLLFKVLLFDNFQKDSKKDYPKFVECFFNCFSYTLQIPLLRFLLPILDNIYKFILPLNLINLMMVSTLLSL